MTRRKPTRTDIFCPNRAHVSTLKSLQDNPHLWEIYQILSNAGGKYVYIDHEDVRYWKDRLISYGEFYTPEKRFVSYNITRKFRLRPYECYDNSLVIQSSRYKDSRYVPCIGFSLMELEDCWIQHTWLQYGKHIIETTPIHSIKYFGIATTYRELWEWQEHHRWVGTSWENP